MRGWLPVLALLLASGCTGAPGADLAMPGSDVPASVWSRLPLGACAADDADAGLSPSLSLLGFNEDGGEREELDTAIVANRTILAASYKSADILEFYDVTDPAHPEKVSEWQSGEDVNDDFKFLPDATGIIIVGGTTLRIVDVRDLADLATESTFELDSPAFGRFERGHTIQAWSLAGITYASMAKAEDRDVSIFRVEGAPGGRTLTRVASFAASPIPVPHGIEPLQAHDTWFELDPDAGVPMLWVANVDWGVMGYDVSDPAAPRLLASMQPGPTNPLVGYAHSVAVTHLEGRRLVVAAQEYEGGVLKVWDATDLAAPRLIGTFHDDQLSSFHNMQVVGPYVLATHFAAGLLVFDLRDVPTTDTTLDMRVFAHAPAEGDLDDPLAQVPVNRVRTYVGTYEVVVRDGIVWTIEVGTGVRAFTFGCLTPGDAAATSSG